MIIDGGVLLTAEQFLKDIDEDNAVGLVNKELLRYAEDIFSIDMRIQALKHITEHAIKRSE